jgi:DNA-directed RNA polymerase specialized sigma24 family protein
MLDATQLDRPPADELPAALADVSLAALRQLPRRQCLCIALRHVAGLSVSATADLLRLSEPAVLAIEYRATATLTDWRTS